MHLSRSSLICWKLSFRFSSGTLLRRSFSPCRLSMDVSSGILILSDNDSGFCFTSLIRFLCSCISVSIQDLFHGSILGKYPLLEAMQKLADRDAARLKSNLQLALDQHHPKKIIILTHVPPFKEACYHEGKMSNDDFLPFFSSKATGDVIMEMAKAHSDINFYVLCGHSHCYAYWQGLDNLIVKAGDVVYGKPDIQDVIKVNELFA